MSPTPPPSTSSASTSTASTAPVSTLAEQERSKRQERASSGGRYDAMLRLFKFGLPIAVGALVAVLVLAPLFNNDEVSFVLAKDKVEVAKERMRATDAMYRGEDNKGQPFTLQAGSAVQQTSANPVVDIQQLAAKIWLTDGAASLTAAQGLYDMKAETVDIPGQILFTSDKGYSLTLANALVDLNSQTLQGRGTVSGTMPMGTFSGSGLSADLDKQTVQLADGVQGTLNIGSYSANRLYADNKSRTVVLEGNAKLQIKQGALKR